MVKKVQMMMDCSKMMAARGKQLLTLPGVEIHQISPLFQSNRAAAPKQTSEGQIGMNTDRNNVMTPTVIQPQSNLHVDSQMLLTEECEGFAQ